MAPFSRGEQVFAGDHARQKSDVDVKSSGLKQCRPSLTFTLPLQAAALWRQNLTTVNIADTHCSHVG